MMCPDHNEMLPTYKSFKARKFNEYPEKAKKIIRGIRESSLKEGDKQNLLKEILKIFESECNSVK